MRFDVLAFPKPDSGGPDGSGVCDILGPRPSYLSSLEFTGSSQKAQSDVT